MKLTLVPPAVEAARADLLVVPVVEASPAPADAARTKGARGGGAAAPAAPGSGSLPADLPLRKPLARALGRLVAAAGFSGKEGKILIVPPPSGVKARQVMFIGMGRTDRELLEATRRAAGNALGKSGDAGAKQLVFVPPSGAPEVVAAACEGFLLADYAFTRHKSAGRNGNGSTSQKSIGVACPPEAKAAVSAALPRLSSLAAAVKLARDLGNEPGNILTATRMAEEAKNVAKERKADGMTCRVLGPQEIEKLGMGAFLAVARGSIHEPRLIHLTWAPKRRTGRRVALVGKGLTFDSGGISIKPAGGMEDMKHDMCGAATVIGLFRCLPDLGIDHEVHGIIAACENMPSGSACRPGDVVTSMAGRTIEIINTDAEGRLTLVDAMHYALQERPDVMIDLATLTGACAVALGEASGIMTNDVVLRDALWQSSDATGERAWPLPLFPDFKGQLKSESADVKNLGDRYGGALTAGLFLQEWVPQGLPWAHVDIAGSAWTGKDQAYCPKGATGIGVRTLAHWLRGLKA